MSTMNLNRQRFFRSGTAQHGVRYNRHEPHRSFSMCDQLRNRPENRIGAGKYPGSQAIALISSTSGSAMLADPGNPTIWQGVAVEQLYPGPFAYWTGAPTTARHFSDAFAAMRFRHGLGSFRVIESATERIRSWNAFRICIVFMFTSWK
jgi:hypothetical protein